MRKWIAICSMLSILVVLSCNDRTIADLDKAEGKVAGEDWQFEKGSAYFGFDEITITLMNGAVKANDPCAVTFPASPFVRFTIPASPGNYSIPFGDASKTLKFHEGSSSAKNYSSTSGYIQVVSINEFNVDGIIQASFDEDNDIIGAFFVDVCN